MDKPREIGRFAALAITACVINAASALFLVDVIGPQRIAVPIVGLIMVGVILWVAIGRSRIGRLLFTFWLAYGFGRALMSYGPILFGTGHGFRPLALGVSLVAILINAIALFLLWSRASSAWLQKPAIAS